jgi:hypothetical protein
MTSWRRTPMTQTASHDEVRAAGAEIAVTVGVDAAIARFETRGLLPGRAQ